MFLEQLNLIADRIEGLEALALVGADGLPVDSLLRADDIDLEMLCAEMVSLVRSISANDGELGAGPLQQILVETDKHVLLTASVASEYYLLAVGGDDFGVGRARFELRRARLALASELS